MNGVIFIGLQASGKSSFYLESFYKTHIRINRDMLKTRHREATILDACLGSKQPCVIDNTNPTVEVRGKYIHKLKASHFNVAGYYFRSSLQECLIRNARRKGKECIPDVGVRGTYQKLELPTYSEGFDQLHYVTLTENGFVVEDWRNEI